jgi:hypothetical protein
VTRWSEHCFEAFCSGAWLLFWTDTTLYWVAHPQIRKDEQRRPHADDGPALTCDLEDLYLWHGILLPKHAITDPLTITTKEVDEEVNAETRRVLIERMGAGRYLSETKAKVVDMDGGLRVIGGAPRVLFQASDGSRWMLGTDGSTSRTYYMPVPRTVKTCAEAHARIAGFDESKLIAES